MSASKQTYFDSVLHTFDSDGNQKAVSRRESTSIGTADFEDEEDLTNIFDIGGEGYDVTLSLAQGRITWKSMVPKSGNGRRKSKGLSGLFKGAKNIVTELDGLDLREAYGAKIRRRRRLDQKEGEGNCVGFGLFTFERKDNANILKDKIIFFEHPSEDVCTRWVIKLSDYIGAIPGRPKTIKMFFQEHAGSKTGRFLYRHTILPMFKHADVSVDMTEVQHNEHIKQEMIHMNLEDFDCIVSCGGDGTASKVSEALLNRCQKDNDVDVKPGFTPCRCNMPLGIIPTGITNHIAGSVMGTPDPVTAMLHIIYGHHQDVDVCSVYSEDKFLRWAFNSQYGFAGNVLSFRGRYSQIGAKKMDFAFMKALTKSKLRSYSCDVEYIPAPGVITPVMNTPCRTGCRVCWKEDKPEEQEEENMVTQDLVRPFDHVSDSDSSVSSESLIDISNDNPWKTVKGTFMNVALLGISGRGEFSPNGLSKFTHLADGNMDLVLVRETNRKDFIRFLRRHGNAKNQFDFKFVEVHRVKEVRFRPRLPSGWNYRDHNFSEIDYEISKAKFRKGSKSVEVLNDSDSAIVSRAATKRSLFSRRADSVKALNGRSESSFDLDNDDDDDDDDDSDDDDLDLENGDIENGHDLGRRRESAPVSPLDQKVRYVGPQYRKTFLEVERAKRQKKQRKKEEKAKSKEERRMRTFWNIDNEVSQHKELEFKVHHALLKICGEGVSPETDPADITMGCLQIIK